MILKLPWSLSPIAALLLAVTGMAPGAPLEPRSPGHAAVSSNPFPGFAWSAHPDAFRDAGKPVGYEIQISKTESFEDLVDQDRVALNRYIHDKPLAPGTYHWRVRAVPHGEPPGDWSRSSAFTLRGPEIVVSVEGGKDPVAAVREALAKARAAAGKPVLIRMPPGDHEIDASFRGPLFDLSGLSDVVVDGTGAKIRFSSRKQGLAAAKGGSNLAVMGFDCSFEKGALRVQGRIRSIDAPTRRLTVEIEPGYPGFDASDNARHDIFYLLDTQGEGRLKTGAPNFFRAEGGITRETGGLWSFSIPRDTGFCKAGDRFGFNFRSGSAHLVDFSGSRGLTVFGITTTGWGGMQFVSIEGDDFRILDCKTRFGPGDWMTGNADGIHVRGHATGPWIEGVRIQAIGDDAIALYARPAWMKSIDAGGDQRTALCRSEFFNLEPGDEVSFFQPLEGTILLETKVVSVSPADGGFKVVFADPLPAGLRFQGPVQQATQIWNRSKSCGDFMVRDSTFINIRRYGTVFRSRRGVIEGNTYQGTSSRAITFRNETDWPNGLYASQIIVRGNKIIDSGFDSAERQSAIGFLFSGYKRSAASVGPRDLLIENNTFARCTAPEIQLTWTRDAVIRDNRSKQGAAAPVPARTQAKHSSRILTSPR